MSDTGLYSHWYHRIRGIAELVDDTLIELRSGEAAGKSSARLRDLLTAGATSAMLTRQALSVLLRDANSNLSLERIGEDLRRQPDKSEVQEQLEQLADILERERANTIEQMRK